MTEPIRERRFRGGLLFPLVLIAMGATFLLANLGYIPPLSVRSLLALWPLILVVVGIEILFARRDPLVALALQAAAIALGVALVAAQPAGLFAPADPGRTEATVARENARTLSLRVSGGAGEYTVAGGAVALVEARSERGQLRVRTERRGDQAEVRVDPGEVRDIFRFTGPPQGVHVRVASDVPASIRLQGGAGDFTVDMRDITVTDAHVESGASNVHVILPTPRGDVPVRIEAGAASVEIAVPAGVEARVTMRGGALSLSSSNPRLAPASGVAETAGYAAAKDRVTVTFEGGAASVSIR